MPYGPDTFFLRMAAMSISPRVEDGDALWVDPDELAEMDGRRVLRALCGDWPELVLDAVNETMILGVVVFAGRAVCAGSPTRAAAQDDSRAQRRLLGGVRRLVAVRVGCTWALWCGA